MRTAVETAEMTYVKLLVFSNSDFKCNWTGKCCWNQIHQLQRI